MKISKLFPPLESAPGGVIPTHKKGLIVVSCCLVVATFLPLIFKNYNEGRALLALILLVTGLIIASFAYTIHKEKKNIIPYPVAASFFIFSLVFTVKETGVLGLFWLFPAASSMLFIFPTRSANIFNVLLIVGGTWTSTKWVEFELSLRLFLSLLFTVAIANIALRRIEELQIQLRNESLIDPLTGAYNRRNLSIHLKDCLSRNVRKGLPSSIVTLDIDHFKKINDNHGHDAGDAALVTIAKTILNMTRDADLLFRLGGEEFLLLLRDNNASEAMIVAESVRSRIENTTLFGNVKATVSIGVCEMSSNVSRVEDWLSNADRALYEAKESGRNQTILFDSSLADVGA